MQEFRYTKTSLENGKWVITEAGHDYLKPKKACTFAIDTETQVYFKGKVIETKALFNRTRKLNTEQKRKYLSNVTWAWQIYEEVNGFFMTNDFEEWLKYQCRAGLKFGWCYNSTFDFAQIDYELLGFGADKWKPHEHEEKGSGKGYDKGQGYTYESIHNDMGSRYAYKLWFPYHHKNRHNYVHAVEYRDFMKLITGGLAKLLKDLDVRDNDGNPIRKLSMKYQAVNTDNLTDNEIDYCCNDVKGLYFAIKKFNDTIEEQSAGECHIFGKYTNLMTAGGFAKRELLRSLYPNIKNPRHRLKRFQDHHPLTLKQDEYIRNSHLYRGGISYVNPKYKGKLLYDKNRPMYRYDVNSEYPYAMSIIDDLTGKPIVKTMNDYDAMQEEQKSQYEAIYVLTSVSGKVKKGYLGLWYDPFRKDYVDIINEDGLHLMFERELNEMSLWYDYFEYSCEKVLLLKKNGKRYRPFVEKNYELKVQAKKDKNPTLQAISKLKLNSSYGKLAERIERVKGHYELNPQTKAVHFVVDETETETGLAMNVIIGALITATARCYILSKIREVCKGDIANKFVYIDTDSIHAFAEYDKADAYTLGGLKLEARCEAVKYVLPKTYCDIEKVNADGTIDGDLEIHSKGINTQVVKLELKKKQKGKLHGKATLSLIDRKIDYGAKYVCLVAMNVQGGKVLIPTEKYLARRELAPKDEQLIFTNYEGSLLIER